MKYKQNRLFETGECPDQKTLFAYLNNTLLKNEAHELEVHLLDCEFCSEAIEGYNSQISHRESLAELKKIDQWVQKKNEHKLVPIRKSYGMFYRIAALIVLGLITSGTLYFLMQKNNSSEFISEASVPLKDSVNKIEPESDVRLKENKEESGSPKPNLSAPKFKLSDVEPARNEVPPPTETTSLDVADYAKLQENSDDVTVGSENSSSKDLSNKENRILSDEKDANSSYSAPAARASDNKMATEELESLSLNKKTTQTVATSTRERKKENRVLDLARNAFSDKKYSAVIQLLNSFKTQNKTDSEESDWMLANSFFHTNEIKKATSLFKKIESSGGAFSKQASSVLDTLK